MSKKDALIKEIDEISERVRFWRNVIQKKYIKELEKEV
jgi:hypothetical protein